MAKRYLDSEDRKEQKLRSLGTRDPVCIGCDETDSRCLELHHIAGKKHHEDTAIVCRNCHRKLSDQQLDHAPLVNPKPQAELADVGFYLLGLCDLLSLVIETLRKFGNSLINHSKD